MRSTQNLNLSKQGEKYQDAFCELSEFVDPFAYSTCVPMLSSPTIRPCSLSLHVCSLKNRSK